MSYSASRTVSRDNGGRRCGFIDCVIYHDPQRLARGTAGGHREAATTQWRKSDPLHKTTEASIMYTGLRWEQISGYQESQSRQTTNATTTQSHHKTESTRFNKIKQQLRWLRTRKSLACRDSTCTNLSVSCPYEIIVHSVLKHINTTRIHTIIWQFIPLIYGHLGKRILSNIQPTLPFH